MSFKYYKVRGCRNCNKKIVNFYKLLRFIGKYYTFSNKRVITTAFERIKKGIPKDVGSVTYTEIRNLIRPNKVYRKVECVDDDDCSNYAIYYISTKSYYILQSLSNIVEEIEKNENKKISSLVSGFTKGNLCKYELISNFDDKFDILRDWSDSSEKMISSIYQIRKIC